MANLHFKCSEFECPCCGKVKIKRDLLVLLETLRILIQAPIKITSGYRCKTHNQQIGGAPSSKHMRGMAADITSRNFNKLKRLAFSLYLWCKKKNIPMRIGINTSRRFVHIDVYPKNSFIWTYSKDSVDPYPIPDEEIHASYSKAESVVDVSGLNCIS